ncbi:DUF4153 domain-containing protein [Chelatococcus reniformis]|uniref:DUF4153 domain-containing protein n=1 Tax=Chelatococcus reniformis TaxID=1494448 RepID=A0A916U0V9_9HYPH|nr:DUF4153 domain-containing protein [Chelatococcus reniformis]GGC54922.1 hypothetical protein GCM10010994_12290 [Chelatococcus reniformis]
MPVLSFSSFGRGARDAAIRFPVPILIAAAFAAAAVAREAGWSGGVGAPWSKLFAARFPSDYQAAFLATVASTLWAEGRGWPAAGRIAVSVVAAAATFALLWFSEATQPSRVLVFVGFGLAVVVAPFGVRRADGSAVWAFGAGAASGAVVALLGFLVLVSGAFAIEQAIRVLLLDGVLRFGSTTTRFGIPVFLALAQMGWLRTLPRHDAQPAPSLPLTAPVVIAKWVLVPVLAVYALVLLAYAGRLAVAGSLPKGQIGTIVPWFGAIGTVVFLGLQRERDRGQRVADWFCRLWFPSLVIPVGLLVIALGHRIEPLGLTERRGILLVFTVWLVVLVALFAPRLGRGDIRLIPGVLLVLSVVFAAGPFGLVALGNRDQAARLTAVLEREGMIEGGRIRQAGDGMLGAKVRVEAMSIIRYLGRHHGLTYLAPLFAGRGDDPFRQGKEVAAADVERRITGFPNDAGRADAAADPTLVFSIKQEPAVLHAGAVRVLGPFRIGFGSQDVARSIGGITASTDGKTVTVTAGDGRSARFELIPAIQKRAGESAGRQTVIEQPVELDAPFGSERLRILLQGGVLTVRRSESTYSGGSFYVVIEPAV